MTKFANLNWLWLAVLFAATDSYSASLDYSQPVGLATETESIPVWLRLTLDQPIDFNLVVNSPIKLTQDQINEVTPYFDGPIPEYGEILSATIGFSYGYQSAPDLFDSTYKFQFGGDWPGRGQKDILHLNAGIYEFLAGTYTPNGEINNTQYRAGSFALFFSTAAKDPNTGAIFPLQIPIASTCNQFQDCALVRTITTIPEPSSIWLFALGIASMSWLKFYLRRANCLA